MSFFFQTLRYILYCLIGILEVGDDKREESLWIYTIFFLFRSDVSV